jgi:hypothetical protein
VKRGKVVSFEKYSQARQRAKARSKFTVDALRQASAENGISEALLLSGAPNEDQMTEIFFGIEVEHERLVAEGILEK